MYDNELIDEYPKKGDALVEVVKRREFLEDVLGGADALDSVLVDFGESVFPDDVPDADDDMEYLED